MNRQDPVEFLTVFDASWGAPVEGVGSGSTPSVPPPAQELGVRLVRCLERAMAEPVEAWRQEWETLCALLLQVEDPAIFFGYGGVVCLNRQRLRLSPHDAKAIHALLSRWGAQGHGGLILRRSVPAEVLHTALHSSSSASDGLAWVPLRETRERWERWSREDRARRVAQRRSPAIHAIWLYGRLLQWVQRRYNPLQPRPQRKDADAILRAFLQLTDAHSLQFLGFQMEGELTAYQTYHVANTVILSVMFGQALGLSSRQRFELGWAALEHDLGKLKIPAHLLQKAEPLSAEEMKEIERLPLHTVQQLVGQTFSWERLKQALIALDVRLRPLSSPRREALSLVDEPSMVMSRVISLCACFDALCSERPFRPAMKPLDALALMRGPLAQQFDPILLRRFVAFLWPVVRASSEMSGEMAFAPSQDPRPLKQALAPPKVQEFQRELHEYRALKQLASPSPEEIRRTQQLQRFLALQLQSSVGTPTQV